MSWDFNPDRVGMIRRLAGRKFQTDGATKLNERSPNNLKLRFGILKSFSLEDGRVCDVDMCRAKLGKGRLPHTKVAILYSKRNFTSRQRLTSSLLLENDQ